jgi:hypothetical protein
MLAGAHRQAAEDIEKTILPLQAASYAARVVIEGAWGAAFHWIALAVKQNIRAIRRVMHAWEHFLGVKERE